MIETQTKACPNCGGEDGWWCKLTTDSMVFFEASGEKLEERLYYGKRKYCEKCNHDITNCVEKNHG